ncbi:MAG: hypothetical protein AAFY51_07350 [Pseudomonadota bacterium]
MVTLTLSALFALVAVATALTLVDCWIRGRFIFEALQQERALLDAGFVPMAAAGDHRPRKRVRYDALAVPSRVSAPRLNRASTGPARDAA